MLDDWQCLVDGHAMAIVGYTPDYWIIRNSWSTGSWGINGSGYGYFKRGKNLCGLATEDHPAAIAKVTGQPSPPTPRQECSSVTAYDYDCADSTHYCLEHKKSMCAPGSICSPAFHREYPTVDPCIDPKQLYTCNKVLKRCLPSTTPGTGINITKCIEVCQ